MRDRDDIDLTEWARRTFDGEPRAGRLGDTVGDDLARAHAGLTRRRRWTAGASGIAVAAVAFAIAMAPGVLPSASDGSDPAGSPDSPHRKADSPQHKKSDPPKRQVPTGDGYPDYEQRMLLLDVARDHFDPQGEHLSNARNVQSGFDRIAGFEYVGTKLNWKVAGESGLGMVQVAIATPGMSDRDRHFQLGCDWLYPCERRELPDGSAAWVGQDGDGVLGVAYQRADGESVWVIVDPLFGNNSTTPVSNVDVSVDQLLAFVADERLEFLESNTDPSRTARMPARERVATR